MLLESAKTTAKCIAVSIYRLVRARRSIRATLQQMSNVSCIQTHCDHQDLESHRQHFQTVAGLRPKTVQQHLDGVSIGGTPAEKQFHPRRIALKILLRPRSLSAAIY